MLTIFTTCKPFIGLQAIHQRNALTSWTLQEPRPEIMVFGDEGGVAQAAEDIGFLHIAQVARDSYGLPYLDIIFRQARAEASNDWLMWANADIIMVDGVVEAAGRCAEAFPGGFLGVCRRWDIPLDEPLHLGDTWRGYLRTVVQGLGELYTSCSSDVFIFKRPLPWAMPPFAAGRPKWDNAMLWLAAQHRTPVIDLTDFVLLAHPRHGYGPDGEADQKAWRGHPSGQRNEELAGGKDWCFHHVRRAGWLWRMRPDGIIEKA
jgi:hypothetical protein